MNTCKSFW